MERVRGLFYALVRRRSFRYRVYRLFSAQLFGDVAILRCEEVQNFLYASSIRVLWGRSNLSTEASTAGIKNLSSAFEVFEYGACPTFLIVRLTDFFPASSQKKIFNDGIAGA